FFDDAESDLGWSLGVPGDDAVTGIWIRADPVGTSVASLHGGDTPVQPEDDHTPAPGVTCFVTGNAAPGAPVGEDDVDGGSTTFVTPTFDLTRLVEPTVSYWRWYSNASGPVKDDTWVASISNDGGSTWTPIDVTDLNDNFWKPITVRVADFVAPTSNMRLRFVASDLGSGSYVEAAVGDFPVVDAAPPPGTALSSVSPAHGAEGGDKHR